MLADTDAGSLIAASQSGAQWGYRMVLPQVILIPILYVVQEMTVRLGIITGEGHGLLIRKLFGRCESCRECWRVWANPCFV
jgi:Mn2+/Fe2+ NRAMP family transporter